MSNTQFGVDHAINEQITDYLIITKQAVVVNKTSERYLKTWSEMNKEKKTCSPMKTKPQKVTMALEFAIALHCIALWSLKL